MPMQEEVDRNIAPRTGSGIFPPLGSERKTTPFGTATYFDLIITGALSGDRSNIPDGGCTTYIEDIIVELSQYCSGHSAAGDQV